MLEIVLADMANDPKHRGVEDGMPFFRREVKGKRDYSDVKKEEDDDDVDEDEDGMGDGMEDVEDEEDHEEGSPDEMDEDEPMADSVLGSGSMATPSTGAVNSAVRRLTARGEIGTPDSFLGGGARASLGAESVYEEEDTQEFLERKYGVKNAGRGAGRGLFEGLIPQGGGSGGGLFAGSPPLTNRDSLAAMSPIGGPGLTGRRLIPVRSPGGLDSEGFTGFGPGIVQSTPRRGSCDQTDVSMDLSEGSSFSDSFARG